MSVKLNNPNPSMGNETVKSGTVKPAASGPSASKAHGTGEPFEHPKSNPGRQPNQSLGAGGVELGEPIPPAQDYGQGAKAPAASNNDVSE